MHDTPATLLHRLCGTPAPADWERFVRLFSPLMQRWARRLGVTDNEADDLLQECFIVLIRKLPEFQYDPQRSFRAWLWTVFRNAALAWRKRQPQAGPGLEQLEELASPDSFGEATEAEYRGYVLRRIMQLVQTDFPHPTWQVFRQVAIEGKSGSEVAQNFGISVNAVYLARSRVMTRLREELTGLDQ